jgi:predicted DNA-binding ribbon-helix-helix protein
MAAGERPNDRAGAARPVKRSFSIAGHRTSISLEAAFWEALREAAGRQRISLAALVQRIDEKRGEAGLSSAVRVWLLDDLRRRLDGSP